MRRRNGLVPLAADQDLARLLSAELPVNPKQKGSADKLSTKYQQQFADHETLLRNIIPGLSSKPVLESAP